jgi:hypothetical protein
MTGAAEAIVCSALAVAVAAAAAAAAAAPSLLRLLCHALQ